MNQKDILKILPDTNEFQLEALTSDMRSMMGGDEQDSTRMSGKEICIQTLYKYSLLGMLQPVYSKNPNIPMCSWPHCVWCLQA